MLGFLCNPVPPESKSQRAWFNRRSEDKAPNAQFFLQQERQARENARLHVIMPSGDLTWDTEWTQLGD